jgi:hypothetical protein
MATTSLSGAKFVQRGYGQVEPNHLSMQRRGQIYAQLPAAADIDVLENGQFVKYDYANGEVNFTGKGRWKMVYNEVKIYKDRQTDADFAMIKQNYNARIYSPVGQDSETLNTVLDFSGEATKEDSSESYKLQTPAYDYGKAMAEGTKMVPRVVDITQGDIYTTNAVNEETLAVGDELTVGEDGFLCKTGDEEGPVFVVVKVYTLGDYQQAVKLQCIA